MTKQRLKALPESHLKRWKNIVKTMWYPRPDSNRQALRRGILNSFDSEQNQSVSIVPSPHTYQEQTVKAGSAMSRYAKPAHKRVSRVLGYCLTLGGADAWSGFAAVAAAWSAPIEWSSLNVSAWSVVGLSGRCFWALAAGIPKHCEA
ncbi:hypothetical protein [Pseudooceanicola spongiae]|uniref:hypothetical protein n=1 Tax=Pseudooceanicola spongiae TaxID=2613965 RepID=UPI001D01AD07|nr:hypothetical protein [Pseudooceanicola spongiae]